MDTLVRSTSSGRGLRTFSRRNRRIAAASPDLMASSSYRRDRAKRRQIFLKTYRLKSAKSDLGSPSSGSSKLKKAVIKLKMELVSALSFTQIRSLRSCNCKSAISVSHPQAVEKRIWVLG
ncbi:hypothetical protein CDL15_Pgr023347 [Punica granatum]|uniref:Uncharacterized protein n=1 Tax=Punica granatum TaxID=22663 RepID=A0A218Y1B6_PUNGR|nr:hypothetical protein CDL15_Pgr023347 [Punica granatum]PKI54611.1 hypothetical protein CRG98_024962 [Punica granatum]